MKRLGEWNPWAPVVLFVVLMVVGWTSGLVAVEKPAPPLTTFEQHVATRCGVLFAKRPFTYFIYTLAELNELRDKPAHLKRVKAAHMGTVVLWKTFMVAGNQPSGVKPIGGHWSWSDPEYMAEMIEFLSGEGFTVLAYVSPHTWNAAGLPAVGIVDEVKRLGVKGLYFDGWQIGDRPEATLDVLTRMHNRGYIIWLHGSSVPFGETREIRQRLSYLMPGGELATGYLYGEAKNNLVSDNPAEFLVELKAKVSLLDRAPATLPCYKAAPGSLYAGRSDLRMPILARCLIAERASRTNLWAMERDYLPTYRELGFEYHQDREAFVGNIAKGW